MKLIDLTHPLEKDMPVFPGDPAVSLDTVFTVESDGCRVTRLTLGSHAGTHLDAPRHVLPHGASLDALPPERFMGRAVVADCTSCTEWISAADLEPAISFAGRADMLLLRTGLDHLWGTPSYFTRYPVLSREAVERILAGPWQLVGMDWASPDAPDDTALPNHRALLGAGVLILENLRELSRLPREPFPLFAVPLFWTGADGAPAQAIAVLED